MSRYLTFVKHVWKKIPKNGLKLHLKVALFESLSRDIFKECSLTRNYYRIMFERNNNHEIIYHSEPFKLNFVVARYNPMVTVVPSQDSNPRPSSYQNLWINGKNRENVGYTFRILRAIMIYDTLEASNLYSFWRLQIKKAICIVDSFNFMLTLST